MSDCLTYTLGRKDISTDADRLVLLLGRSGRSTFSDLILLQTGTSLNNCNYMIWRYQDVVSPDRKQGQSSSLLMSIHDLDPARWAFGFVFPVWLLWVVIHPAVTLSHQPRLSCETHLREPAGQRCRPAQKGRVSRQAREAQLPLDQRVSVGRVGLRMGSFVTSNLRGSPLGPGNFDWTFAPLDIMWTTGSETHFICFWKCHFDWWGQHLNLF